MKKTRDIYMYTIIKADIIIPVTNTKFKEATKAFKTTNFPKKPKNGGMPPNDINIKTLKSLSIIDKFLICKKLTIPVLLYKIKIPAKEIK